MDIHASSGIPLKKWNYFIKSILFIISDCYTCPSIFSYVSLFIVKKTQSSLQITLAVLFALFIKAISPIWSPGYAIFSISWLGWDISRKSRSFRGILTPGLTDTVLFSFKINYIILSHSS